MNKAAEAPPVHVNSVTHFFNDLWRQILRSSTNWSGWLLLPENLRQSKICEFDVTNTINDDILGLQTK